MFLLVVILALTFCPYFHLQVAESLAELQATGKMLRTFGDKKVWDTALFPPKLA